MIEVTVDKIAPTSEGLVLGCVVRYGKEGPVRFARAVIPWSAFGMDTQREMVHAFAHARDLYLDTEPDEPLF